MPNIYALSKQFRADLLSGERAIAGEMVQAYGDAWLRIKARLDALTVQIEQRKRAGQDVSFGWLYQHSRLQSLQSQVEQEIARFARFADQSIRQQQSYVVQAAQNNAKQLTLAGLDTPAAARIAATWNRLSHETLERLVGTLRDGSPLKTLFDRMPGEAGAGFTKALVVGVATGQNPTQIARAARLELGVLLTRALTISRTEVLRSYRQASIEAYQANSDVVEGWIWTASLSKRTCAACIAMHGTFHPVTEEFGSHPNCRCCPTPATDTQSQIESGVDWFARQDAETQETILGPDKYTLFQAGEITLPDLVGYKDDPRWGPGRCERSIPDALAAADRRLDDPAFMTAGNNPPQPPNSPQLPTTPIPAQGNSIPDVEIWARANIRGVTDVDLSALDLDVAQPMTATIKAISDHYEVDVPAIMPLSWSGWNFVTPPDPDVLMAGSRAGIGYSDTRWQGIEKQKTLALLRSNTGTAQFSRDVTGATAHEMAHILARNSAAGLTLRQSEDFAIGQAIKLRKALGEAGIRAELGDYAWHGGETLKPVLADDKQAALETWAEAYSAYYADANSLSSDARNMVQRVIANLYPGK